MTTQKALLLPSKQGAWIIGERPIPKVGKDDVLVRYSQPVSFALNPADWKIQKFGLFIENFPAVLGADAAGEVVKVGEDVTNFVPGDKVLFQGFCVNYDLATFQQYATIPADILAKIPPNLSFDDAATVPSGLATAACGFYDSPPHGLGLTYPWIPDGNGKYKDMSVVVLGGSSSVGQFAIQLAALSGFSPIITTSSMSHESFLKGLGATHVVDRKGDVVGNIKKLLKGGVTDIVFDAISVKDTQTLAVDILKPDGSLILTRAPVEGLDVGNKKTARMFGMVHTQRKLGVSLYKELTSLLETGTIRPNRYEVLPSGLEGIIGGLERMAQDQVSGVKLVAHPFE